MVLGRYLIVGYLTLREGELMNKNKGVQSGNILDFMRGPTEGLGWTQKSDVHIGI